MKNMRTFISIVENADDVIIVYRGEYSGNKNGNFWTQDKEFARQFTQSGRDTEIKVRYINKKNIYMDSANVYAGNPDEVDKVIEIAKSLGFKAVLLNEGHGEPNSIFVFDRTALKFSSRLA